MPSFQLYEISEKYNINTLQKINVLNDIKEKKDDPKTVKSFIESVKKTHRNFNFIPDKVSNALKIRFEEFRIFPDNQTLWIGLEKRILHRGRLLLIGKSDKKIEQLISFYLRDRANLKPIYFGDKFLWSLWSSLKSKVTDSNKQILLHRVILRNTFLDEDKVSELNIHAKNLDNIILLNKLVEKSEKVKAITYKIKGFYEENKWTTFRLDKNGSILLYGKHGSNILLEFLNLLNSALS